MNREESKSEGRGSVALERLSHGTRCEDGKTLVLCGPAQWPLAPCGHGALAMSLIQLWYWILIAFNFKENLNSLMFGRTNLE